VFARAEVAVFVDGCFWHGCPKHQTIPKANPDYWIPKLKRNKARDREVDDVLRASGWTVVRIWEHDDVQRSTERIRLVVKGKTSGEVAKCS
jgi:DNA mismatch endonuclease (patch repair protein)